MNSQMIKNHKKEFAFKRYISIAHIKKIIFQILYFAKPHKQQKEKSHKESTQALDSPM